MVDRISTVAGFRRSASLAVVLAILGASGSSMGSQPAGGATDSAVATAHTQRVSFPPELPGGERVVSDTAAEMLSPADTLRDDVDVASTAPTVDFLYYPGQDYPGNPWSAWGDSLAVGGNYYASIGDHLGPGGNAFVYEYDPGTRAFRQLLDLRDLLDLPEGEYTPGKIHSRLDMGSDGWLYFATHRGSARWTTDEYDFEGDWIVRVDPRSGAAEVVVHAPVPKHSLPAGILDPDRLIYYAGTTSGEDSEAPGVRFLAYDVAERRVLFDGPHGPNRYLMLARSTGRVYYTQERPGMHPGSPLFRYDPDSGSGPMKIEAEIGLRAATLETPQGTVYAVSSGQGRAATPLLYAFDVASESVEVLGPAPVGRERYIASLATDPSGRYLYYVAGAHGKSHEDGSPVVQFDTTTRRKKVLAFLHPFYEERYGAILKGTYSLAVDPAGDKLYVTWNVSRGSRAWDSVALTVIHVPQAERLP